MFEKQILVHFRKKKWPKKLLLKMTLNNITGVPVEEAEEIFRQYPGELQQTEKYGVSL